MAQIHNLTLRVLHHWIASNITLCVDPHRVRVDDLHYLFAFVRKIKVNPTIVLIEHWISTHDTLTGPITFTSYVTKIARKIGAMRGASDKYLDEDFPMIGAEHFVQAHLLRLGWRHDGSVEYSMCYPGYEKEVKLPAPRMNLYTARLLTINLEEHQPPKCCSRRTRHPE